MRHRRLQAERVSAGAGARAESAAVDQKLKPCVIAGALLAAGGHEGRGQEQVLAHAARHYCRGLLGGVRRRRNRAGGRASTPWLFRIT
ncbi:MAG: hypothetical protein A2051_07165 [Desulfovibrionales bacterium GWA2_65_9]|nr:MAG: hypothetical protein A2051_07165 [Desulfovibrionales bacterium GWA2_65_9]